MARHDAGWGRRAVARRLGAGGRRGELLGPVVARARDRGVWTDTPGQTSSPEHSWRKKWKRRCSRWNTIIPLALITSPSKILSSVLGYDKASTSDALH